MGDAVLMVRFCGRRDCAVVWQGGGLLLSCLIQGPHLHPSGDSEAAIWSLICIWRKHLLVRESRTSKIIQQLHAI